MPIIKNPITGEIEYTERDGRFDEAIDGSTGVQSSATFAIADEKDALKQLSFDTSDQASNSKVVIKSISGSPDTTTVITLPASSGPLASNPMTAEGDLIVGGPGGIETRLPAGPDGYVVKMVNGVPDWAVDGGAAGVTAVTGSSPISSSGGATPIISIDLATDTDDGYLSSADHAAFAAKQDAGDYITALNSDVTAVGPGAAAATVVSVGGSLAADVHSAELAANAAASANTVGTIVKRDGSGNFAAGTITAALTGTASGNPPNARTISTTAPLTGGGDLSANRTLSIPAATDLIDGYMSAADHQQLTQNTTDIAAKVPNSRLVSTTGPLAGGGALNADLTLSIPAATDAVDGYLTAADHTAYTAYGTAIAAKAPATRLINTTSPITGGGDLSADRTIAIPAATDSVPGYMTAVDHAQLTTNTSNIATNTSSIALKADKAITISTTAPITGGGDLSANRTLAMAAATNSVDGYLTAADHTTFAAKQAAGNYITALTSDVTASGPGSAAATVVSVGGSTAALVNTAEVAANAATSANTNGTIVKRDGSGNFSANTITANLSGAATGNPPNARLINTTGPITGGGDLSADRTLAMAKATASVDGYLAAADFAIFAAGSGGGGASTSITQSVALTSHGFSVGNLVYKTASSWAKGRADSLSTSCTIGVVTTITDANNFVLTTGGVAIGLSGLTAGTTYYLSAASAGATTTTVPANGNYIKPVYVAISTTTAYIINDAPQLISSTTGSYRIESATVDVNGTVSNTSTSGWLTYVTGSATMQVAFATGIFSGTPTVVVTGESAANADTFVGINAGTLSATGVTVQARDSAGGGVTTGKRHFIVMGPR